MTLEAVAVDSDDDRCKAVSWRLNDMGVVAMSPHRYRDFK